MVWALLREGDGDYADTFMMILLKADKESPDQHLESWNPYPDQAENVLRYTTVFL